MREEEERPEKQREKQYLERRTKGERISQTKRRGVDNGKRTRSDLLGHHFNLDRKHLVELSVEIGAKVRL